MRIFHFATCDAHYTIVGTILCDYNKVAWKRVCTWPVIRMAKASSSAYARHVRVYIKDIIQTFVVVIVVVVVVSDSHIHYVDSTHHLSKVLTWDRRERTECELRLYARYIVPITASPNIGLSDTLTERKTLQPLSVQVFIISILSNVLVCWFCQRSIRKVISNSGHARTQRTRTSIRWFIVGQQCVGWQLLKYPTPPPTHLTLSHILISCVEPKIWPQPFQTERCNRNSCRNFFYR